MIDTITRVTTNDINRGTTTGSSMTPSTSESAYRDDDDDDNDNEDDNDDDNDDDDDDDDTSSCLGSKGIGNNIENRDSGSSTRVSTDKIDTSTI